MTKQTYTSCRLSDIEREKAELERKSESGKHFRRKAEIDMLKTQRYIDDLYFFKSSKKRDFSELKALCS